MRTFILKTFSRVLVMLLCIVGSLFAQVPTVTSFTPVSGAVGTAVTITGTNFNVTAASNIVYFGATKATVTAATATSLSVTVPAGATYKPITVLNTANGLAGSSLKPFALTYTGMVSSGSLESPVSLNGNTYYPREAVIADFDGDGKADIATVAQNGFLSVYRNTATSGSITASSFANKVDFGTGSGPFGLAVADLDRDGKLDIVVANSSGNSISIFRNTATSGAITTASFAAKVDFAAVSSPNSLAVADLDADGKPEIAVTNSGSNSVSVFKNASTAGSITATSFATRQDFVVGTTPNGVVLGDVDGDGKPEMAVANYSSNTMSVLRNLSVSGTISFNGKVDFATGSNPYGISMGDLDGDGKLDLAVSNYNSYTVSIYRNAATSGTIAAASLAARVDYSVPAYPTGITLGDLNGDGKQEILVSAYGNGYPVTALKNAATSGSITGTSFSAINYNYGYYGYGLAVGDLDGDGKADVVNTTDGSGQTIQVYRNNPAPIFSSFSPATGAAGTTVTISGRNFTAATAVKFNAVNATSFTVVNDNQITAVAPTGVTSGFLSVTTAIGTGTSTTYFYAAPTITSFTPVTGGSGASVTITGTNLLGTNSVQFGTGGSSAPTGTPTNTSVVVKVPGNASTGTLRLSTPYGTVASTATFTPTVLVSSFSPTTGTAGTTFTIYGSGFTGATAVKINNVAVSSFIVQTDSRIYAVVQNGVTTGTVSVTSPTGTGTSIDNFYAAPSITSFTPTAAATGATVTITGLNFTDANTVSFNGVNATPATVSATSITVAVPAGAISGPLTVNTPYGSSASSAQFTAVPLVNSLSTYSGPVGSTITINGKNFTNISAVKFNGVSAGLFTVNSSTQITANVPSGVTEGAVSVTNTAGTGSGPTFSPTPTVTAISPVSGPVGTTVTITGLNFTGATTVRFYYYVDATPISITATTITVAVPSGAYSSYPITVFTPSGSGSSSMNFTVTGVPSISNFSPTSGSIGSSITINGSNFIGTTALKINGVSVSSFTVDSESQITAVIPNGATSGPVSVTNAQGTATTSSFFIVNLSSSITGFSSPSASPGQTVTISGLNLSGASAIYFGGVAGTVTNSTATTVTAVVPNGALSGSVQITTPLGTCTSLTSLLISPRLTQYYNPNVGCSTSANGNYYRFFPSAGQPIYIQGENLENTVSILINGIPCLDFGNNSSSELYATVPNGVSGIGFSLVVTTAAGSSSIGIPVVTNFSPATGNYGSLITITGNNLNTLSSVKIGGISAPFTITSPSQIIVVVPSNCTSGTIECSYPVYVSGCSQTFYARGTSTSNFIVLRAPEVSSFTPTAGGAGTVVTITGNHFLGATAVRFNNVAATSFTVIDNNTIQATAPTGVTSGVISVVHPGGTTSSTQIFNLMAAPTITATGLSVLTGPVGTQVTITGTNFLAPASQTSVSFAGITCPFSIISATQILAVIPPGGFTSAITVKTPGGSATSAQQFTPTGITTIRVDSVTAVPNLQIVVPVRARGFASLIGLQFRVPTPAGLTYVGVEQLNATLGLTTANFSNVGGVQFTWSQASNTATNLTDNTVLFAIRYSVPVNTLPGTKFNLSVPVSGFPLPLEATKSDFTIQSSTAINGFVRIALASIAGTIKTGNGTGVPRAILVMKTSNTKIPKADTTASDGSFSYDSLVVGANYSMQADKNTDPFPTNGVTVSDIALIQRHVLATSLLGDAYKVIAADVDNSKSVTVADVAFIRDLILQTRSSFPLGKLWKMVKASQTFANANSPWPLDTAFTYTALPVATASQNFIGCKLGDVNDSWNSAFGRAAVSSSSSITLAAGNASVNPGQAVTIPVSTAESDAMAVQFTLRWPKDKLQLVSASPVFGGCVIGTPTDSTLTVLATDPAGALIAAGSTLVNLQFTALGSAGTEAEVQITGDVTPALAYDADMLAMNLNKVPGLVSISGTTAVSGNLPAVKTQLWPNPAGDRVFVKAAAGTRFELSDALGRVIHSGKSDGEILEIPLKNLPSGLYQMKAGQENFRLIRK